MGRQTPRSFPGKRQRARGAARAPTAAHSLPSMMQLNAVQRRRRHADEAASYGADVVPPSPGAAVLGAGWVGAAVGVA